MIKTHFMGVASCGGGAGDSDIIGIRPLLFWLRLPQAATNQIAPKEGGVAAGGGARVRTPYMVKTSLTSPTPSNKLHPLAAILDYFLIRKWSLGYKSHPLATSSTPWQPYWNISF